MIRKLMLAGDGEWVGQRVKEAGRPRAEGPAPGFVRTAVGSLLHSGAMEMQRNGTDSEDAWAVDFLFVVGSECRGRGKHRS